MLKKIIAITICFAMMLSFASCGASDDGSGAGGKTAAASGTSVPEKTESVLPEDGVYVKDGRAEEGEYDDGSGVSDSYSYHMPRLQISSETAEKINKDIEQVFGEEIDQLLACMENKETLPVFHISWESYENDDILSLVITSDSLWEEKDYYVVNYDLAADKKLDAEDLPAAAGYDTDSFRTDVVKAAVRAFDSRNRVYSDSFADPSSLERRAYTAVNCLSGEDLFYLKDGQLHCIVTLGSMAGAATVKEDVIIENESEAGDGAAETCSCGFISARRTENHEVYVSFEDTEEAADSLRASSGLKPGEYLAEGCCEKYCGMHIGSISGEEFHPVLFLLTEDSHVEYIDIYNFVRYGTLCSGNILTGVSDTVSFEDGEEGTVYAVSASGEKTELGEAVRASLNSLCAMYTGTGSADVLNNRTVWLEIPENSNEIIISEGEKNGEIAQEFKGTFISMGMNGSGQVIGYDLADESGVRSCGSFEIPAEFADIISYDDIYIYINWLAGDNPFNTMELMEFQRSFG